MWQLKALVKLKKMDCIIYEKFESLQFTFYFDALSLYQINITSVLDFVGFEINILEKRELSS